MLMKSTPCRELLPSLQWRTLQSRTRVASIITPTFCSRKGLALIRSDITNFFSKKIYNTQSVPCIQITKGRWLFSSQFWPLLNQASFFEVAEAVLKIGWSPKSNHHEQWANLACEMTCTRCFKHFKKLSFHVNVIIFLFGPKVNTLSGISTA